MIIFARMGCVYFIIFAMVTSTALGGPMPPPWVEDPDDWIDAGGKSVYDEDRPAIGYWDRDAVSREDLNGGKVTTTVGSGSDAARAGVVQNDGKLVIGGRTTNDGANDFAIVRFFPDGSLDTTYGTAGRVITTFGSGSGSDEIIHSMAIQTDGKVVAAGKIYTAAGDYLFAVARYNSDGTLDTTFNRTGKITANLQSGADIARAVLVDTTARIVVGGYSYNGTKWDAAVVRYASDGSLDTSYYTTGSRVVALNSNDNSLLSLQLNSAGSILGAGAMYNGTDFDAVVVRFNTDGTFDTTFNRNGKASNSLSGGDDFGYAVSVRDAAGGASHQGYAKVIAAGGVTSGSIHNIFVTSFLTDGTFDTTFNVVGKKVLDAIPGYTDSIGYGARVEMIEANPINILVAGKALVSGSATDWDFMLARVNISGALDTSFFTAGNTVLSAANADGFGNTEDAAQGLVMKGEDVIYAVGRKKTGVNYNMAVARFNTDGSMAKSGTVDKGFGTGGTIASNFGVSGAQRYNGLAVSTDDTLYATGYVTLSGTDFRPHLARYGSNGALMLAWNGLRSLSGVTGMATSVSIQTDGLVVIDGYTTNSTNTFFVARFRTDGEVDTSFSNDGYNIPNVSGVIQSLAIDSTSRAVAVGYSGNNLLITRFATNGAFDTSFATRGHLTYAIGGANLAGKAVVVDPSNGKIVAAMDRSDSLSIALLRVSSDGVIDTSFGTNGAATQSYAGRSVYSHDVSLDSQGRYWVEGISFSATNWPLVARYSTNGFLDTSFDTDGFSQDSLSGNTSTNGTLAENDKYIISTNSNIVIRYQSNGSLDTTFGTSGSMGTGTVGHQAIKLRRGGQVCGAGYQGGSSAILCGWQ